MDDWISATGRTLSAGLASDASLAPAQARRKSKFRYTQSRVFSILGTKAKNATSCGNAFEANIDKRMEKAKKEVNILLLTWL
ncbi:hypothetical protein GCM10011384_28680 [Psychrobacillus lasiicapitis]|nr:hypothetical protein GCM10011384_28680 [Psychrobacillus lasiicapitis]